MIINIIVSIIVRGWTGLRCRLGQASNNCVYIYIYIYNVSLQYYEYDDNCQHVTYVIIVIVAIIPHIVSTPMPHIIDRYYGQPPY